VEEIKKILRAAPWVGLQMKIETCIVPIYGVLWENCYLWLSGSSMSSSLYSIDPRLLFCMHLQLVLFGLRSSLVRNQYVRHGFAPGARSVDGVVRQFPKESNDDTFMPVEGKPRWWMDWFCVANSGGSSNQTLWSQLVDTVGPSHIRYSKILLVSSKPVGQVAPQV
jgi:hypothetical protein